MVPSEGKAVGAKHPVEITNLIQNMKINMKALALRASEGASEGYSKKHCLVPTGGLAPLLYVIYS